MKSRHVGAVVSAAAAIFFAACGPGVKGEVIANTSLFAAGLTQDDDFLYWRTDDAIVRLSKQGGAVETVAPADKPVANTLTSDRVFWINQSAAGISVHSAAKTGGDEHVVDPDESAGGNVLRNLTTDGTFLYWSNESGQIRRAPVIGGDAVTFAQTDTRSSSVAVDNGVVFATFLFWIVRLEDGVQPVILQDRFDVPDHITLASPPDDYFYWVERGSGAANGGVYKAPKAGGDAARLATREVSPDLPFSDGQSVYFSAGASDERIRRARVFGSSEASDFSNGHGDLVVDATHVYWIDRDGAVRKAPK